jgi:hypothetical protein
MKIYLPAVLLGIITWTSVVAETTGNLADIQQLHLHTDYTYDEVSQTINLDTVLPEDYQVTGVDWSVLIHTYDNAIGCYSNCNNDYVLYAINGYDAEGNLLGTTGIDGYIENNTGSWAHNVYSGTIDAPEALLGLSTIEIVEGGQDTGFWGGYYGPMFHNQELYVTYEITPSITPDVIAEVAQETLDVIDLIQPDITAPAMHNDVVQAAPAVEEVSVEETEPEIQEELAETETSTGEESTASEESSSQESVASNESGGKPSVATQALQTLQLVQGIEQKNTMLASGMGLVGDFTAYETVKLTETIALQDNEDWYSENDFYGDSEYTENLQLSDKLNLKETQFYYGRTYQFY